MNSKPLRQGFASATTSLVMIAALSTGFLLVTTLEAWRPAKSSTVLEPSKGVPEPSMRPLTAQEREWAAIAWRYFERNVRPETGLVDSADRYPASTLWDTGSYLMALLSAEQLGLIAKATFDDRLGRALSSLARLPLYDDGLPNKSYNTISLAMVDYNNQATPRGIGWSAIDVGRILVPLNIVIWRYPHHTPAVHAVLERWRWKSIVADGLLYGGELQGGETVQLQEGRLGYEEYSAKSFALAGLDVQEALRSDDFVTVIDVDGVSVATDSRRPQELGGLNHVVSEPYILDGIEFGFDRNSREMAWRVMQAQEARYRTTGILTAVSEDNLDTAPYFVYNTVFTDGKIWNTVTPDGKDASEFKSLSTKAAIGWHALYGSDYTKRLVDNVASLFDKDAGWYSGRYERTGQPNKAITANTNAIVLEALCYIQHGQLLKPY